MTKFQNTAKIAIVGILLLVALLGTIFLGKDVAKNFAKASTCTTEKVTSAQVTANSGVVTWNTSDVTQGMVQYGTNPAALNFSAPEATSGKTHNVPLTLLTPSTTYYYIVTIGTNKCDSTGNICTDNCVPWNFTTAGSAVSQPTVTVAVPTPNTDVSPTVVNPTVINPTVEILISPSPKGSDDNKMSEYCTKLKDYIGSTTESSNWETIKTYDLDNNGIINGKDALKCGTSGK